MNTDNLFIGLMSGTSIDAVDAVALEIDEHSYKIINTHSEPMPADLRAHILDLCEPQNESIQLLAETGLIGIFFILIFITTLIKLLLLIEG